MDPQNRGCRVRFIAVMIWWQLSVLLLCLFAFYEHFYLSAYLEIDCGTSCIDAIYMQLRVRKKNTPALYASLEINHLNIYGKIKCVVTFFFSFWTCLCNKSAVLLGYRTQPSNELHTIFHYSIFPELLDALHSENAFCLRCNGTILVLM